MPHLPSIRFLLGLTVICASVLAFAHGEDKPGPHKGYIRMPGAYHTEVVELGPRRLRVYLLDIKWANPSVKNSSLELIYEPAHEPRQSSWVQAKCTIEKNSYLCEFPETVDLTHKGRLRVKSQRQEQKGNEVQYSLPFSLEAPAPAKHGGHH